MRALTQRGVFDGLGIQGQGRKGEEEDKNSGTMTDRVDMDSSQCDNMGAQQQTLHPPRTITISTTRANSDVHEMK